MIDKIFPTTPHKHYGMKCKEKDCTWIISTVMSEQYGNTEEFKECPGCGSHNIETWFIEHIPLGCNIGIGISKSKV